MNVVVIVRRCNVSKVDWRKLYWLATFNLLAGNYQVIVTDTNGCFDTASVTVSNQNAPVIALDAMRLDHRAPGHHVHYYGR